MSKSLREVNALNAQKSPMTEIIGNDDLKSRLSKDILFGSLPHACIIEGPRGTGKHTIARMCAAALACSKKSDTSKPIPCLECYDCKKVLEGKSPDLIFVNSEEKATIGVDSVRFLKEDVHIVPNDLDYKIYVIEDADKMTPQAQNAFLLTLEEPPAYVKFFLLCENSQLLLETIRSRAPVHRTELIPTEKIDEYLVSKDRRAAQMKLSAPKDYEELLKASGNGIGRALDFLEPDIFSPILKCRKLALEFVQEAVNGGKAIKMLPILQKFPKTRSDFANQMSVILDAIRDLTLLKKSDDVPLLFFVDRNEAIELCDKVSLPFLLSLAESVRQAIEDNAKNANLKLALMRLVSDAAII